MRCLATLSSLAVLAMVASSAQAAVLSFEDVPGAVAGQWNNPVPDGYAGYDWTNFSAVDRGYLSSIGANAAAATDGDWAAVNKASASAAVSALTPFNFYGATFTRAWDTGPATMALAAYVGGVLVYSDSFTINSIPLSQSYSWTGIDRLVFTPTRNGLPTLAAIDQLNLAPVPEPESYAMLLAGLGLIGAVARRRKVSVG